MLFLPIWVLSSHFTFCSKASSQPTLEVHSAHFCKCTLGTEMEELVMVTGATIDILR